MRRLVTRSWSWTLVAVRAPRRRVSKLRIDAGEVAGLGAEQRLVHLGGVAEAAGEVRNDSRKPSAPP